MKVRELVREWRARAHRSLLPRVRWVAVTGSVGKTTTTVLMGHLLERRGPVVVGAVVTRPNSLARLCQTMRETGRRHRGMVMELSAHGGEASMRRCVAVLRPQVTVVTAIGDDHRTTFGSRGEAARIKSHAVAGLTADGVAVLNADDPLVWAMRAQAPGRVIGYGRSPEAELRLLSATARWPERLAVTVSHGGETVTLQTRLVGLANTVPVLAALAGGLALGLPLAEVVAALAEAEPVDGRLCPHETTGGVTFLDNSWKSPLHIVPAALEVLATAQVARRIAVFGAISDFTGRSSARYRQVARQAMQVAEVVIFCGSWGGTVTRIEALPGRTLLYFPGIVSLRDALRELLRPGDLVLFCGSSRMDHFDRLILDLKQPVTCWTDRCRAMVRCGTCRFLRAPPTAPRVAVPAPPR